jgi:two-component system NarL family sensor kinase
VRGALATLNTGASTDLATALMENAHAVGQRANLQVRVASEGQSRFLPLAVRAEIVFLLQEALINVEKHAHARRVDISLAWTPDMLTIELADDGRGFNLDEVPTDGHLGLAIMWERACNIGGQLAFASVPGSGTRVTLRLPLNGNLRLAGCKEQTASELAARAAS